MPQNVEIVRQGLEAAWKKPPDVEILNRLYHPGYVLESNWGVEGKIYRGASGFREALADLDDAWEEWREEVDEVVDADDDRVVVVARFVATAKSSGAPVDQRWGLVFQLEGGQIVSTRSFVRPEDAFAAVGLRR